MNPAQCRAARALLNWTQPQLAASAKLGLSTVVDFEKERRVVSDDAREAMRVALEAAGIEFFNDTGVRLLYRIIRDGKPDPETKFIRDLEQAKTFALEYVHADPSADVLVELAVGKATWWRYDKELGDWVSTSTP